MSEQKPQLIITTGRPASGKSTLAKWLSKELGMPCFSKDNLREVLFDSLGWKDRKCSQMLGRASIDLMFYVAEMHFEAGCSAILDNSFDPSLSDSRFQALKAKYGIETIQIVCDSDKETLYNRFRERAMTGHRHQGHGDQEVLKDLHGYFAKEQSVVLNIGGTVIEVDTTDFSKVDYQAILNEVKLAIQKYQAAT
jgi:predicted kinase